MPMSEDVSLFVELSYVDIYRWHVQHGQFLCVHCAKPDLLNAGTPSLWIAAKTFLSMWIRFFFFATDIPVVFADKG